MVLPSSHRGLCRTTRKNPQPSLTPEHEQPREIRDVPDVPGAPGNQAGAMTETPTQPPPQAPTHEGWNTENLRDYRGLRRSRDDRKVAGVAGGLGRHLNMDPTILRVLFVVLIFFGGAGLVMYGAMWLLVPEEGTEKAAIGASESMRNALLIGVGVVAALLVVSDVATGYQFPWTLLVIGLVLAVVLMFRDRRRPTDGVAPPVA